MADISTTGLNLTLASWLALKNENERNNLNRLSRLSTRVAGSDLMSEH